MITPETAERIRLEYPQCFRCGSTENLEVHHAIYHKTRKKIQQFIDSPENLVMLCHRCNVDKKGYVESYFFRCLVWSDKLERGYLMNEWESNIPIRVHDHFIYIGKDERFK